MSSECNLAYDQPYRDETPTVWNERVVVDGKMILEWGMQRPHSAKETTDQIVTDFIVTHWAFPTQMPVGTYVTRINR